MSESTVDETSNSPMVTQATMEPLSSKQTLQLTSYLQSTHYFTGQNNTIPGTPMGNGSHVRTVNVTPKSHSKPKSKDKKLRHKKVVSDSSGESELTSSSESEPDSDGMDNCNNGYETAEDETESSDQHGTHCQSLSKNALKSKESFKSWVEGAYEEQYNYLAPDPRAEIHPPLDEHIVCIFPFKPTHIS
jgi:hypothetical protein